MKTRPSGTSRTRSSITCDKGLVISPARKMTRFLSPAHLLRWVPLFTIGAVLGTAITAFAGPRGATPWAVIKCKFADQPQEPIFDPEFITAADGMAGYWRDVSYGQITLDGSTITGWYTLPFTLAEAQAFPILTKRNQIVNACKAAATDVDFSQYYGVIAIVNAVIDSGNAGNGRVLLDPYAWAVGFAAEEMGHAYGQPNHPWLADPPTEYGNPWDSMSYFASYVFQGRFGRPDDDVLYASGPGLSAPNVERFGWMPGDRSLTWDGTSETLTLAALNRPLAGGYLMSKVPIDSANPNHYYTVEFRRKTDWDAGIPRDTVLINEVRTDGLAYLINGGGGAERLPDQTFRDVNNNVAITVLRMDSASETATVNIGRNEVWVDFGYHDPTELGTFDFPYNTLAEGLNTIAYNGTLKIKAGSANETATIRRKMLIKAYGGTVTIGR